MMAVRKNQNFLTTHYYVMNSKLAGAPGFEPGNVDTKNRCLTTWRRPTMASNNAHLFGNPAGESAGFSASARTLQWKITEKIFCYQARVKKTVIFTSPIFHRNQFKGSH